MGLIGRDPAAKARSEEEYRRLAATYGEIPN
jgi:hypothetical protein